jgi:uncharacterized protein YcbK (DUF882 family)
MRITPNFSLAEFACKDGTPYPDKWIDERLLPLCETLEVLRVAVGGPITIDSGYRTLEYDTKLYEASKKDGTKAPPTSSQHPKGRAADIRCALAPHELFNLTLELYQEGKLPHLGGVGLYPSFVHIDVRPRPNNHLAIWGGSRPNNIA